MLKLAGFEQFYLIPYNLREKKYTLFVKLTKWKSDLLGDCVLSFHGDVYSPTQKTPRIWNVRT